MAFAQLTWRESLRDIEASLSANASKLYANGALYVMDRRGQVDLSRLYALPGEQIDASAGSGDDDRATSGGDVLSRILLGTALVLANGFAFSAMSECETKCEKSYKSCGTSGKSTPNACLAEREKCRKSCNKKAAADLTK